MELSQLPLVILLISNIYSGHTEETPKPTVAIKPDQHIFRGQRVTLRCDISAEGVSSWKYSWYKDDSDKAFSDQQEHTFSPVTESDAGKYSCKASEREGSRTSHHSDEVTLTVSASFPRAVLRVSPQTWLTEGDPVTLICEVNSSSTGWTFSWYTVTVAGSPRNIRHFDLLSDSSRGAGGNYIISSAALKHTGVYVCKAERGSYKTWYSNTELIWVTGVSPPVSLIVSPSRTQHFVSEYLSLSCEDQSNSERWRVRRYTEGWGLGNCSSLRWGSQTGSTCTISYTRTDDTGVYWCESESGEKSPPVNITVHSSGPRAVLRVSPQTWLTEGDPVTLICEVNSSSTGWTFSWFIVTVSSDSRYHYKQLSDSSRGAGGSYTVSSAALKHTGVYLCRAERGKPDYYTTTSKTQLIWVTGVSPPVSLIVSPSRTQHFIHDSLSLSCEDQSNSTGWRVIRYLDRWRLLEDCSLSRWGSQTGSTCTIRDNRAPHTGVYWCESESGEKYHPVNITVHYGVILESPVHPVTEGDNLTLRCLYQNTTPPNLRADFYKDGSLIQNQTTEMIISTVSKSHEGFYSCKYLERRESPKSWISVTGSQIFVLHTLSSVLAVSPYLLVTVVLIYKCCRMRAASVEEQETQSDLNLS